MKSGLLIRVQSREPHGFPLLEVVKNLLLLDADIVDYDALLGQNIDRAIDDLERFTGLAIGQQTRRVSYSVLTETTDLPYGPYIETVSIDAGGTVDADGRLTANWPIGGSIVYTCGYTEAETIAGLLACVAQAAAEYSGLNPSIKPNSWQPAARKFRTFTPFS